jgi:hypothetical protein
MLQTISYVIIFVEKGHNFGRFLLKLQPFVQKKMITTFAVKKNDNILAQIG